MPKINVYLPDDLAAAVRDTHVPVSAVCQNALERAVRDVTSLRATDEPPASNSPGVGAFARFTPRARKAVALAEDAAREVPHNHVGTEHLLLGLIKDKCKEVKKWDPQRLSFVGYLKMWARSRVLDWLRRRQRRVQVQK